MPGSQPSRFEKSLPNSSQKSTGKAQALRLHRSPFGCDWTFVCQRRAGGGRILRFLILACPLFNEPALDCRPSPGSMESVLQMAGAFEQASARCHVTCGRLERGQVAVQNVRYIGWNSIGKLHSNDNLVIARKIARRFSQASDQHPRERGVRKNLRSSFASPCMR